MNRADNDAFWDRVLALAANLDGLNYYELLGIDPTATAEVIKAAYYRRAPGVHPDRHTYERDRDRQRALTRLYARFGEAFRVLKTPAMRQDYDQGLASGRTRLSLDEQTRRTVEAAGPDPRTPHARVFYEKALPMLERGNAKAALAQLRLAAQFESDSAAIAQAVRRCEAALAESEAAPAPAEPEASADGPPAGESA